MSTQELEEVDLKEQVVQECELILHNDDFNTFEHVINCLVSYCEHKEIQAEQCAYIVHHNGKCSVKKGAKFSVRANLYGTSIAKVESRN